jgi:hypothetical protein
LGAEITLMPDVACAYVRAFFAASLREARERFFAAVSRWGNAGATRRRMSG